ncbi:MAG: hypothetical protein AB1831_14960, partial [Pseudomonadota bacterium]
MVDRKIQPRQAQRGAFHLETAEHPALHRLGRQPAARLELRGDEAQPIAASQQPAARTQDEDQGEKG